MNRGKVGEERGGKETDGCPLTGTFVFGQGSSIDLWFCMGFPGGHGEGDKLG
jgi:hypothetical protein